MSKRAGLGLGEVILIAAIVMLVFIALFYPVFARPHVTPRRGVSAAHNRQMALAGILYGADYNDALPIITNGWLCRMQNVKDGTPTVNCPAPGTQSYEASDAAGGQRTDAWPILFEPYLKSRGLYVDPGRWPEPHHIFDSPPVAVGDPSYDPEGATYRNQDRFPMYGMNYMFLSPLRVPKSKRGAPIPMNYAVSEGHKFAEADDPSGTVFFTESQRSMSDQTGGFFVVNAPGMWQAFVANKDGYIAFWTGTSGSGDWVGTKTACADYSTPCANPMKSSNFVYLAYNNGCNASFLDGHVKYYHDMALAAGTDYPTAIAGSRGDPGSGAKIIDKKKYLWNLTDKNFYGL